MESEISRHVFAIPAVKAVGFGAGQDFAALRGSEANDPFTVSDGAVRTVTNRSGGVNAGITNGMDVVFDVTFRPTPSIAKPQQTVELTTMTPATITVAGRHDSCVALRAAPAVEAAAALALCRLLPDTAEDTLPALRQRLDELDAELTALFARRQAGPPHRRGEKRAGLAGVRPGAGASGVGVTGRPAAGAAAAGGAAVCSADGAVQGGADMSRLILIGLPGSGKTTLGRMAAQALALPFYDCDDQVSRAAGMTIPDIFARRASRISAL